MTVATEIQKSGIINFSISGEFITNFAREQCVASIPDYSKNKNF